jgi:type IV fimbrial biogenesis protein FimT
MIGDPVASMRARGFSLIETMIVVSLMALLLMLALPTFTEMMANAKVRNVSEGMMNGLRQAQLEAVRRNANVRFRMTTDGWEVRDVDTDNVVKSDVVFEATSSNPPKVTTEPDGATEVTFTGLGRTLEKNPPVPPAADGTDPIAKIKIDPPDKIGTRSLGIAVAAVGGNLKMCDPDSKFTYSGSTDPLACPFPG